MVNQIETQKLKQLKNYSHKDLLSWNKRYTFSSWGPQTNFNPTMITKAEGVYLWDHLGNRHLDFSSQLVLSNIGHSDKRVINAMKEQMDQFQYIYPGHASALRGLVGKKLAEITPGDLCKTFFTLGGADANENAMKIARYFTGRQKIVTRYRSYHGATFAAASAGGDPRRHMNQSELPWIVRVHDPYYLRSPLYKQRTREQGDQLLFDLITETIQIEGANTIAAIMLEGFSGSSGVINPGSNKFWKQIRDLCDKHGILLIVDEVMSGFGRTGKWFGIEHGGIVPDIMTMAKGLTSGYAPLGAVIVNQKIAQYFDKNNFNCGLTYSAHPVSLAAANATLDIYQSDKLIARAKKMGQYLGKRLLDLKKKHVSLGDVRGEGLLWVMDLVKERKKYTPLSPWNEALTPEIQAVHKVLKEHYLQTLNRWNWIFIAPPLVINEQQLEEGLEILDKALSVADKFVSH